MDINFFTDMYIPIVLAACLIVGYVLKNWIKDLTNKWIPTILTVLGAILACIAKREISLLIIVSGAFTGLASTGMHQLFKNIIEIPKETKRNDEEKP